MGGARFNTNNKGIIMKLSLTMHGKTYSVESEEQFDGEQVSEVVEQFKGLLVNAGYHPHNVDELFNTEYQWFDDEQEMKLIAKNVRVIKP